MATTELGGALTEEHRAAQVAIASEAIQEFLPLWSLLDPLRLDETTPAWLDQVVRLIERYRLLSARRAFDYFQAFKAAESPQVGGPVEYREPPVELRPLLVSMTVVGPVREKQVVRRLSSRLEGLSGAERERELDRIRSRASAEALESAAKALQRHVLDGGREVLTEAVNSDRDAVGWARVTDSDPCYFCAMLASRGFVYESRDTALRSSGVRGNQRLGQPFHDGCGCTAEPRFHRDAPLPGDADLYSQLWDDTTQGLSGKAAVRAFRRAYEGRN